MTSRISTSLCRVIFESPEVHDAALLMSILQEDLTVLDKLGYPGASVTTFCLPQLADLFVTHQPVDRIVQQKAEREAAEEAIAETEALFISSAPEMTVQETQTEIPITQPKILSPDTAITAPSPQATPPQSEEDTPPPSKFVLPPPSPNIPERECLSPKPGPPRDSITPLSNISTSLYTDLSGFHLILHCI
jgi:hypothetical protein